MISYEEVGALLGLAAARDQRIAGEADVLAWHADLNAASINYADADAALTRFYAVEMAGLEPDKRRRVTTPDVIAIARKIRAERLENFQYEPAQPDETPRQYLARLRGQISDVASGRRDAPRQAAALEGGPHPEVLRALAAVGRGVPEQAAAEQHPEVKRPGPLGRECPRCKAAIGRPCRTPGGRERSPHPRRSNPTPADPNAEQQEIARRRAVSAAALARTQEDSR